MIGACDDEMAETARITVEEVVETQAGRVRGFSEVTVNTYYTVMHYSYQDY